MVKKYSAVNLNSLHKLENASQPFMLILHKDDNLMEGLINCAEQTQFASASFTGFGAIKNVEIGFFNEETKIYKNRLFADACELISMQGTITKFEGKYFVHVHVAISDDEFRVYAGHLHRADVAVIAEISIIPFAHTIERKHSDEFGLKLISAD